MSGQSTDSDTPVRRPGDPLALTAFCLGLAALVLASIPFVCFAAFPVVLAAAVCGIISGIRGTSRRTESFLGMGAGGFALVLAALVAVSTFQQLPLIARGFDDAGGWDGLTEQIDPQSEPYVVPDARESRGVGDDILRVEPVEGAGNYGYAHITAQGEGPFQVVGLDSSGEEVEYLVDVVGSYDGYVLWNLSTDYEVVSFRITADESWSVFRESLDLVPEVKDGGSRRGVGDQVFWYGGEAATATLTGDDGTFGFLYSSSSSTPDGFVCDLSESSVCSGTVEGRYGSFLQVYADHGWTLGLSAPGSDSTAT